MKRFVILMISGAALGGVSAADAATTFASSAAAATANVSVANIATAAVAAAASSGSGLAGGTVYDNKANVATIGATTTLVAPSLLTLGLGAYDSIGSGIATSESSSNLTSSASATTTIANPTVSLYTQIAGLTALTTSIGLTANTITSTSTAGINGSGLYGSGNATIAGLSLSGSLLGTLNVAASILANPTANYTLLSLANISIVLNEQIQTSTATGLEFDTNAIHVALNNYNYDGQFLTGNIVLGHSQASVTGYQSAAGAGTGAVPEPASWAMMVGGFGMLGGALRASRKRGVAAIA